jgi:hypothetical protein
MIILKGGVNQAGHLEETPFDTPDIRIIESLRPAASHARSQTPYRLIAQPIRKETSLPVPSILPAERIYCRGDGPQSRHRFTRKPVEKLALGEKPLDFGQFQRIVK